MSSMSHASVACRGMCDFGAIAVYIVQGVGFKSIFKDIHIRDYDQ